MNRWPWKRPTCPRCGGAMRRSDYTWACDDSQCRERQYIANIVKNEVAKRDFQQKLDAARKEAGL